MKSNISYWLSLIQVTPPLQKRLFRYQLHQLIWKAFPGYPVGSRQPFLFALTGQEDDKGVYCMVQSPERPRWDAVDACYRKEKYNAIKVRNIQGVKQIALDVHTGEQFLFRLQACPLKNVYQGRNKRGKKRPITHLDEAEQWLLRRAEKQGIHLVRHEIQLEKILVRRRPEPYSRDIRLTICEYQGLLEVMEPAKFTEGLTRGIGKKKIFGLGLMMLARA